MQSYQGGCHCGAVRFTVECESHIDVEQCNCSVCKKAGFLHLIVPQRRFRLVQGEQNLTEYTFNTGIAKHRFCTTCGIKSFYVPRSNPTGVSVNARCLDTPGPELNIVEFDGQNWERNAHKLAHKSD
ncbi:GFA family protein [Alteromonas sediminis]|uniref:GFA family protein n=1 Tax=Alteromonas sediminis TaxID=2259342 RepID=A0A3N5Y1J2_9ALTE|nr:GFA family protein [Alteromonas sediminis]RPJ66386.1 GFA family protein [Alteromonas sediminis]